MFVVDPATAGAALVVLGEEAGVSGAGASPAAHAIIKGMQAKVRFRIMLSGYLACSRAASCDGQRHHHCSAPRTVHIAQKV
jgi:hypothetical protein